MAPLDSNASAPEVHTIRVDGMTCAGCAGRVARSIEALPGVEAARVSAATHNAQIRGDADAASIAAAVKDAGYEPRIRQIELRVRNDVSKAHALTNAMPGVLSASSKGNTLNLSVLWAPLPTILSELAKAGIRADPVGEDLPVIEDASPKRVIWAAILTLPVFLAEMGGHAFPAIHHALMVWPGQTIVWGLEFVLAAAVLAGPGRSILTTGFRSLLKGAPEMNSLVAMGATAAFLFSTVSLLAPSALPDGAAAVYFEAACVIVTLILLGRWLEDRAKRRAGSEINRLAAMQPRSALVERDGEVVEISSDAVLPGDILRLKPGGRVPVDANVLEGESQIDQSMMTGEPLPVSVAAGDAVVGGTVNGPGALRLEATATGADMALSRIIKMVEDAQGARMPVEDLVDRVTRWFVPMVILLALAGFTGWLVSGVGLGQAVYASVSVLIIACPCAMGLATPTSIAVASGRAASLGVLFRRGDALQQLSDTHVVAFDKTGTLTEGHPAMVAMQTVGVSEEEALALAAGIEANVSHPLAQAMLDAAAEKGVTLAGVKDVEDVPGFGVTARIGDAQAMIGAQRFMDREGIDTSAFAEFVAAAGDAGQTVFFLAKGASAIGAFALADPVKEGARQTIQALSESGHETALLSGDSPQAARTLGESLGVETIHGGLLPRQKREILTEMKQKGGVAFVGDGINDAPALATADVGIAIGTGTDVAIEAADVVLTSGDPRGVASAIRISGATLRNIRQNLFWAFGYNVVLIPVAMAGLLTPGMAAGAMALSSLFVVGNALRLRRA